MSSKKISELTPHVTLTGDELIPVSTGGTTKSVTVQQIRDGAGGGEQHIKYLEDYREVDGVGDAIIDLYPIESADGHRVSLSLSPTGGSFVVDGSPDVTLVTPRGDGAVEIQYGRFNNFQVASGESSAIVGGANNQASGLSSAILGSRDSVVEGAQSTVVGGEGNTIVPPTTSIEPADFYASCSTVLGGVNNSISFNYSVILGGASNAIGGATDFNVYGGEYSEDNAIVGGRNNAIDSWFDVNADYGTGPNCSAIVAGRDNRMYGSDSVVMGGTSNTLLAENSAIVSTEGGQIVTVGSYNALIGGVNNTIADSSVVDSVENRMEYDANFEGSTSSSIVGGGESNMIIASTHSVTLGGSGNTITQAIPLMNSEIGNQGAAILASNGSTITDAMGTIISSSGSAIETADSLNQTTTAAIIASDHSTIRAYNSTIVGGLNHTLSSTARHSIALGGMTSNIHAPYSAVLGGQSNDITETGEGQSNAIVGGESNQVGDTLADGSHTDAFNAAIVAGTSNNVSGTSNVVVGGSSNKIHQGNNSSILGGEGNTINEGTLSSVISGNGNMNSGSLSSIIAGASNALDGESSVLLGGAGNTIHTGSNQAFIIGGSGNQCTISQGGIVGGNGNQITTSGGDTFAVIVGGGGNIIENASYATILGGNGNKIEGSGFFSIVGGSSNTVHGSSSTIAGGQSNSIGNLASSIKPQFAFVAAGNSNTVLGTAGTILNGFGNTIEQDTSAAFIGAGTSNQIKGSATASSIVSGTSNEVSTTASYSTITNGQACVVAGRYSRVGGRNGTDRGMANSDVYGHQAYAAGRYALRCVTTDATPTLMMSPAAGNPSAPTVADIIHIIDPHSIMHVSATVVAQQLVTGELGADARTWKVDFVVRCFGTVDTIEFVGAPTITPLFGTAGASSWTVAPSVDTTLGAIKLTATGAAATEITWLARVETTEFTA